MAKSLLDKLASAVGAKNTRPSPGSPSEGAETAQSEGVNPLLQPLMKHLKQKVESAKQTGGQELQRAQLIELILPRVFTNQTELIPDKKVTKEWAFSLGQTIGLLAGLAIPKDRMAGAIDEILREAKRVAEQVDDNAKALGLDKAPSSTTSATTSAGVAEQAKQEERERTIQNLLDEATLTTEPAAKAALEAMAGRLKREIELDRDNKQVV